MSGMLRSIRWLSLAQASKVVAQLVSLVVLSRMLPPSAYGVMAMAGVVTAFIGLLRDMGTGAAIIQRKTLSPELADTVFWLNVGLGCTLGLLLAVFSLPLAHFFREPELTGVLLALAVTFPIGSATAVHQAMMERHSRFKELAILDVVTQVIGLSLALGSAALGAGVYSFVIPSLFAVVFTGAWLWRKSGWRPGRAWSKAELKSLWGFSGSLTAFNFINYFARNADSMIVGRMLGSTALGQYGMAYKLMLFPVQNMSWVIGRALLPSMSSLQGDYAAMRALYFRVLGGIALLSAPLMLGLWALREPFTATLLSSKWAMVASLLAWLAPVGLMQSFMSTIGSVLTAQGRTAFLLKLGIFNTATVLIGFTVGGMYGVVHVAAGYFFANLINLIVTAVLMGRLLQAQFGPLWREIKAPVIASVLMVLVLVGVQQWPLLATLPAAWRLAAPALLGALVYLGLLALVFGKSPKTLLQVLKGNP